MKSYRAAGRVGRPSGLRPAPHYTMIVSTPNINLYETLGGFIVSGPQWAK